MAESTSKYCVNSSCICCSDHSDPANTISPVGSVTRRPCDFAGGSDSAALPIDGQEHAKKPYISSPANVENFPRMRAPISHREAATGWRLHHPYVPLGATAKAGCWKPVQRAGACAFTGEPAGHARMPTGLQIGDRVSLTGVSTPRRSAFTNGMGLLA